MRDSQVCIEITFFKIEENLKEIFSKCPNKPSMTFAVKIQKTAALISSVKIISKTLQQ